jgi:RNA polymerase sigma factor (sigma-70 family)
VGEVGDRSQLDAVDELVERDLMWRALARLPRRQRGVLVLRYYEALPDSEIAVLLGCAEGTVRSLASRAFETLRRDPHLAAAPGSTVHREEGS